MRVIFAASDLSDMWDFSTPSQFSLDQWVETSGSTARMKAQNYTADAHTKALYHLDETGGSTATDASSDANTGALSTGASWGTGNLNNGASFNGSTGRIKVPDSPGLSLTQSNTLEGWTKFNTPFSAGSTNQRQSIYDKGDYQLYYDNETGKLTYELADSDATTWTLAGGNDVNGSWDLNGKRSVNALTHIGTHAYAAVGVDVGDAEVWEWDGSIWTLIGGGAGSVNDSWPAQSFEGVYSIANDGTNVYAGLGASAGDAEVWRWNGTTWSKIGGDAINASWALSTFEQVLALTYFNGTLYAGVGNSANDGEVWRWNGSSWAKIGGDNINSGWAANFEGVYALVNDSTNLYAGLGNSAGDAEVWRWNGTAWTKLGGDGVNAGWAAAVGDAVFALEPVGSTLFAGLYDGGGTGTTYVWNGTSWTYNGGNYVNKSWGFYNIPGVQVMQSIGGYLYAGLGYNVAGSALVFRYDGSSWTLMGGQGVNGSWAPNTMEQVLSMANYNGNLIVGLGNSANDAEVWRWNGTAWTQIGGDSLNGGWTTNYEEVSALAVLGTDLYAGIGNSGNDAEVWRWNGSSWTKIGGDNINSGWAANFERVSAMAIYDGKIIAGLGASATDAEVWRWSGTAWSKLGGDGINSSWNTVYEQVEALIVYDGSLYAGLGNGADDAEVWEYNGTTWRIVGGDGVFGSWDPGTYERVKTLAVYNGYIYAGLGASTGDGEVWRWDGGTWTKVGGNGMNNGWGATIEEIEAFSAYNGKFYVGLGLNGNADALVYSIGNNAYLQSTTDSFDTNWHHVAATYDGSAMKLYIDGQLNATRAVSVSMPDSSRALILGAGYGGREYGKPSAYFDGMLDELRVSDMARTTFSASPYSTEPQTVTLSSAVRLSGVWHWDTFTTDETTNGGSITYRLSKDGGTTWQYWNGSAWATSLQLSHANNAAVVSANIATYPVTMEGIKWQAILSGDGSQRVALNSVTLESTSDMNIPTASSVVVTAKKAAAGVVFASGQWTNGGSPYFSWTPGDDSESGVRGYCMYLGTDNSADPITAKGILGATPLNVGGACQFAVAAEEADLASPGYVATPLATSSDDYYVTLKVIDNAGNISTDSVQFNFKFDNTPPVNPGFITAPSGFINTKEATLTWPSSGGNSPRDDDSGLAGLQYRIGSSGIWYGDGHSGTGDITDLLANDGSYSTIPTPDFNDLIEGTNTVYFRSWDNAGNVTPTYATAALKINTSGSPSEPQNVTATPASNTSNSFGFSWDKPATYVGDEHNLSYCYTINTAPSPATCTYTSPGVRSLGAGAYATQPGMNTFYVVARDESNNINYASYSTVIFTANTTAPGIPLNVDLVDVSIKATNNWRLAITWDEPAAVGAGVASYRIYRSTDGTNFTSVGSSSSTTYIDAGLTQRDYYYRIKACDNTNNCGALSTIVTGYPTGKFYTPANMVAEPVVANITTRRASISWSTDRGSDSKIAIGTASGKYGSSEVASSEQVSAHRIDLENLSAGTTYYFVAKWTDEDGNTGVSQEYTFTTAPPPALKEVTGGAQGLSSALIAFTSKNAARVDVFYGASEAFGGVKTINTSLSESGYTQLLNGLQDGTKYFFKLISYDIEGTSYESSVFSFSTPPRPRISNLRFQPVEGEPTSTQRVTWETNVPSTTSLTYIRKGGSAIDITDSQLATEHTVVIKDLADDSEYTLIAQSRDKDGNLATSDPQTFRTALDTRPPKIRDIVVESSIRGTGAEARGQVVVSWKTDEPATSQVAYGEGSNVTVFNNKSSEDSALTTEHIVIVTDLPTSRVFSMQPVSRDKARNAGTGEPQSAIIGRASDSVLTIIINSLQKVFGF